MKKFILVIIAIVALVAIFAFSLNIFVILRTRSHIIELSELESDSYDCILVLGAGLRPDGTPSDMLSDRLSIAISLFENGVSDTLLLSGDRTDDSYDEVSAMKKYCTDRGVSESNIVCDNVGYSTFETMHNTKLDGRFEKLLIVTQDYHLYRAVYIALGMDFEEVDGVCANPREYRGQIFRDAREMIARIKDFFFVLTY